jgi:seryl-tRNA synthetase
MLDLKFIRENSESVANNIINKNESGDVSLIVNLDERRRAIIGEVESLKNQRNVVSKEISQLKKSGLPADDKIEAMRLVSDNIKSLDDELRDVEANIEDSVLRIPNMVHESVPVGRSAEDNKVVRSWGSLPAKCPKNHIDIATSLGIIDFERGAKVSGAGFAFYKGKGAALERAIINFTVNYHVANHGYTELLPPFLVNANSMRGTGQLPKMAEDMYTCEADGMYLIPTAEVPFTNFFSGETLKGEELPVKVCGYSPCFRREAGSHGKEVHGFLRVHQFNKVEMVKLSLPEDSYNELESLTNNAEAILMALNIPYRVLLLCSGDTSFSSAKTYDLEIWAAGEEKWLEVSSCSNFEDFQARRANIRFKRHPDAKPEFVHTLNGSGVATSRLMVSIIENNYSEEHGIKIPDVLIPYCGFNYIN